VHPAAAHLQERFQARFPGGGLPGLDGGSGGKGSGNTTQAGMRIQHWQDVASLVVGAWLVVSPFVLGMSGVAVALTIALGLGVILFAVEAFVIPSYLEEWGEMLLGLALVVAPWTVVYEPGAATVNSVLSGLLVILFAVWELMTDRDFSTWWHDRWHHGAG
jgi:hypothetical protein